MIILFDAFGTLFNTQNKSVLATDKIFSKYLSDYNASEIYTKWKIFHREFIQNSFKHFITEEEVFTKGLQYLFTEFNIKGNIYKDVQIMLETLYNRPLFEDVLPVLNIIKKQNKIFIASNSDKEPLLQNIYHSNIPIDGYFSSEDILCYKPNKEFYKRVKDKININFEDILFVGDSLLEDVIMPSKMGMKSIWLNRLNSINEKYSGITEINSLFEIENILNIK